MHYIKKILPIVLLLSLFIPVSEVFAQKQTDENIYYILVDRFVNGTNENDMDVDIDDPNSYYGGDLVGVKDQLERLKGLGFTTVNLSPVMTSSSFDGFQTEDFQNVDPHLGDMSDLQKVTSKAHDEDMKVVLDFVLTHTSPKHTWVSNHANWLDGNVSNQWGEDLPALDLENPEVQNYLMETAVFWLSNANIDGFHFYVDENTPPSFIEKLRNRITEENEEAIVMVDGKQADVQVNREFRNQAVDLLKQPGESLEPLIENAKANNTLYMESVKTPRFAYETVQAGYHPVTRWKLVSTLLYTLPGSSMFYQGVEVPMNNGEEKPDYRMAALNKEDEEIVKHFERLARIYQDSSVLKDGELEFVQQEGAMSVYKRSNDEQTMYIAVNNDKKTQMASLEGIDENLQLRGLIEDEVVRKQDDGAHKMILARETSNIFILEEDVGFNWFFITAILLVLGGFVAFVVAVGKKNKKMKKEMLNNRKDT